MQAQHKTRRMVYHRRDVLSFSYHFTIVGGVLSRSASTLIEYGNHGRVAEGKLTLKDV